MEVMQEPTNLTAWAKELLQKQRNIEAVNTPENMPGSCRICGSATKGKYLDTGHLEEFYGSVYYCWECFHEMASKMGYIKPENLDEYITQIHALMDENHSLKIVIEGYGRVFDGLDTINSVNLSDSPQHPVLVSNEQNDARSQVTAPDMGERARKVVKSVHD